MEEGDVVSAAGQANRVDVLDAIVQAARQARLLGAAARFGDGLGREVHAFDPLADALEEDVSLEQPRPAADGESERQRRRNVLVGEPFHGPAVGISRHAAVDGAAHERLRAPVAVFGLARRTGVPELPRGGALGPSRAERVPSPCERGQRGADRGSHRCVKRIYGTGRAPTNSSAFVAGPPAPGGFAAKRPPLVHCAIPGRRPGSIFFNQGRRPG